MMKKILLTFILLSFASRIYSQIQPNDSLQIVPDTLLEMKNEKKSFGDKLGKFLGIDHEEEIRNLQETVGYQQELIEQLSNAASEPVVVIKNVSNLDAAEAASLKKDAAFLNDLPPSYNNLPKSELSKITQEIDRKIAELSRQRDSLVSAKSKPELIDAKNNVINSLEREKKVINLSVETTDLKDENGELTDENGELKIQEGKLKKMLYSITTVLFVLLLIIAVILQRKRIRVQDVEIEKQLQDINKKNTYLEYAARIIRHDMHSGINTYIPRGLSSLQKRIHPNVVEELKIEAPLQMIREGLAHTQKVYKNVYEFTNLVKVKVDFKRENHNLRDSLVKYLSTTSYSSQVEIEDLGDLEVNEQLFCTAVDNLIKNGLKYNKNNAKRVKIYKSEGNIVVEDNGTGLTDEQLQTILRKGVDIESETGLGLSITRAIVEEHGYSLSCESLGEGTKVKIKIDK